MFALKTTIVRLSQAVAEVRISVDVDDPAAILRGNLVGPFGDRETIQTAYALRPLPVEKGCLSGRIVVPEPNLHTVETPFHYEGNIEVLAEGRVIFAEQMVLRFVPGNGKSDEVPVSS